MIEKPILDSTKTAISNVLIRIIVFVCRLLNERFKNRSPPGISFKYYILNLTFVNNLKNV